MTKYEAWKDNRASEHNTIHATHDAPKPCNGNAILALWRWGIPHVVVGTNSYSTPSTGYVIKPSTMVYQQNSGGYASHGTASYQPSTTTVNVPTTNTIITKVVTQTTTITYHTYTTITTYYPIISYIAQYFMTWMTPRGGMCQNGLYRPR